MEPAAPWGPAASRSAGRVQDGRRRSEGSAWRASAAKINDKKSVDAVLGGGNKGGPDALVAGVGLIGGERLPVGEIDGEAVEIAAFDLFRAFGAAGVDGDDAGELERVEVGEDRAIRASVTSGRALRRRMWRIIGLPRSGRRPSRRS